jgi:DNA-binding NarL/FixJ family response regulator
MCKILIVEDNTTFRGMLNEILHARFPTMEIAGEPDGSELFTKLDAFHPNIIFIDIRLPGENGLELTKKIKMNYPHIIVVILTSYDLPEYRQAALQSKADHFITKDSPTQSFLALVESLCPGQKHDGNNLIGLS